MEVDLALSGARAESSAAGAKLTLDGSGRELAYSRLHVTDANGHELAATLEVLSADRLVVRVDDTTATYPVRIDPTFSDADWVSLNPSIPGSNGSVSAIAVDGSGSVYIGGEFTRTGGVETNQIAKWNGSVWSALGSGMNNRVTALAISGSDLYAGGYFSMAGGVANTTGIAKWNGSAWSALGSGTEGAIHTLATDTSGHLFLGGEFSFAGTTFSPFIVQANIPINLPSINVLDGIDALTDGSPTPVNFGISAVGVPTSKTFTITNSGPGDLIIGAIGITGTHLGDFTANTTGMPTTVGPGGSTHFAVTFTPTGTAVTGTRSAGLHIASNDAGRNPFDIQLTGTALSFTTDGDNDGLSDASEFNMAALGFDWQVNQSALVSTFFANAAGAGLYTTSQVQALNTGTPLIARNPVTGKFKLTMDWKKSTDLTNFLDFPAPAGSAVSINPQGDVEFEFPSTDNAAFYRIEME
jgi:hypothetical protein